SRAQSDSQQTTRPEQEKQGWNYDVQPGVDPDNRLLTPFLEHLSQDQKHFWTVPGRVRKRDLEWILPLVGGTAGIIAADSWISRQVPNRPNQLNTSLKISNYSMYSLIAAGGGAFLLGKVSTNDHLRETGLLSAEAAINATAITYAFKFATQRGRPYQGTGTGTSFSGDISSSHSSSPSAHSSIASSIAG